MSFNVTWLWRFMQTDLKSQPYWLEMHTTPDKPTENVNYGFDANGMFFNGEITGGNVAYPIRTKFNYSQDRVVEVVFTIDYNSDCPNHCVSFYSTSDAPTFEWGSGANCISFKFDCGSPQIDGIFSSVGGFGENILPLYGIYTIMLTYDRGAGKVSAKVFTGDTIYGEFLSEIVLEEVLQPGPFRIGFDADQDDDDSTTAIFQSLTISDRAGQTSCSNKECTTSSFKCLIGVAKCECTNWKYFAPTCSRIQQALGICQGTTGAYVPAITVCNQRIL